MGLAGELVDFLVGTAHLVQRGGNVVSFKELAPSTPRSERLQRRQVLRMLAFGAVGSFGVALLGACAPSVPTASPAPTSSPVPPAQVPTAAQPAPPQTAPAQTGSAAPGTWDDLVAAAEKEGQVVVPGPNGPSAQQQVSQTFKQRFGIDVDYQTLPGSQVAARVQTERAAGQYTVDVFLAGSDTVYASMLPSGWLQPLKPWLLMPEVVDPSVWPTGGPWFRDPNGDTVLQILNSSAPPHLTVNTGQVSADDLKTANTLLDPKWQGKIGAFDPSFNGPGLAVGCCLYVSKGEDYLTKLFQGQGVAISQDEQQVGDWVAHGTYPIVLSVLLQNIQAVLGSIPLLQYNFQDVKLVLSGSSGLVTLMDRPPHPNAAKVFANWIASKEGATLFGQVDGGAPVRTDIPVTWLPADQVPQPGGNYLDTYDYTFETVDRLKIKDFFTSLVK